jgi:signal peptidase I
VLFESRFSIGTLVSFFYPVKTNAFLVIIADVEFATVQDINMMTLMCVDQPRVEIGKEEEPDDKDKNKDEDDTIEVKEGDSPEVVKKQLKRNEWFEVDVNVLEFEGKIFQTDPYALKGKESTWAHLVRTKQWPHIDKEAWTEGQPTEKQVLEAVMKWTKERIGEAEWNKWMKRNIKGQSPDGRSRENFGPGDFEKMLGYKVSGIEVGIGKANGIEVPWILPDDTLVYRVPFRPEHLYDEKDKKVIKWVKQ